MASSKVTMDWNNQAFHQILNSTEVAALCDKTAAEIAREAGEGFIPKHWYSNMKGGRAASLVVPVDKKAMAIEAHSKKLTRAAYAHEITGYR